jgi:hypothetical protein
MKFTLSVRVLPCAADARHDGLAPKLPFRAHLAGHARHLAGEGVELVDHRIDGVLELEDLAAHVHGDLARQVAASHGRRHFGDVAHLGGEVARHRVDAIREVLPGAGYTGHHGLAAELALGTDLAGHARDLGSERAQLVDHRVDGLLQLEDLAAHVDGDLAREVAAGDGDGDFRDVANLRGEVVRHRVDALGQLLPDTRGTGHLRLATELSVGADLARHASHLGGEDPELLDHGVDDRGRAEELALERTAIDVEPHGLVEVPLGDRRDGAGDLGGGPKEVIHEGVDGDFHLAPGAIGEESLARCRVWPCLPTTVPTRCSSAASCWLAATISLKVSAILPSIPVQSPGSWTEKSPPRTRCSADRSSARSRDAPATGAGSVSPPAFRLVAICRSPQEGTIHKKRRHPCLNCGSWQPSACGDASRHSPGQVRHQPHLWPEM